jgi:hypothetical protein
MASGRAARSLCAGQSGRDDRCWCSIVFGRAARSLCAGQSDRDDRCWCSIIVFAEVNFLFCSRRNLYSVLQLPSQIIGADNMAARIATLQPYSTYFHLEIG